MIKKTGITLFLVALITIITFSWGNLKVSGEGNIYTEELVINKEEYEALQIKVTGGTIESIRGYSRDTGEPTVNLDYKFQYVTESNRVSSSSPFNFMNMISGKLFLTIKSDTGNYSIKINDGLTEETAIDYTDLDLTNGNYIEDKLFKPLGTELYVKATLEKGKEYYVGLTMAETLNIFSPTGEKVFEVDVGWRGANKVYNGIIKPKVSGEYLIIGNPGKLRDWGYTVDLEILEIMGQEEYVMGFKDLPKDNKIPTKRIAIKVDGQEHYYLDNETAEGKTLYYSITGMPKIEGGSPISSVENRIETGRQNETTLAYNTDENTYINFVSVYTKNNDNHDVKFKRGKFTPKTGDYAKEHVEELNAEDRGESLVADPIDSFAGNFRDERTLLSYGGNNPLTFDIKYDSIANTSKSLGKGFTHNFETYIEETDKGIDLYWSPGSVVRFEKEGDTYQSLSPTQREINIRGTETGYEVIDEENHKYIFNSSGELLTKKDKVGLTTDYYYQDGLLDKVENGKGQVFNFEYNEEGKLLAVTDVQDRTVTFTYNTMGDLTRIKDAAGYNIDYGYTRVSNIQRVQTITQDGTQLVRNRYDDVGRIEEQYNKETGTTRLTYDDYSDNEKIVTKIEQHGREEEYVHDVKGNLLSVTDGKGYVEKHTYDKNRNRISTTDKNGNLYLYEYDERNRLIKETNPDNTYKTYGYDEHSNLTKITIEDGKSVKNTYENNRLATVQDKSGKVVKYEYDDMGNVTKITDGNRETINKYSNKGYLEEINKDGNITTFETNPLGMVTKVNFTGGSSVQNVYDVQGNLIEIEREDGSKEEYEYDAFGDKTKFIDSDGNVTTYTYNDVGDLTTEKMGDRETRYTYNRYSQITQKQVRLNNTINLTERFSYDQRGNLVQYTGRGSKGYSLTYDGNGNVLTKTTDDITESYTYDSRDNLIESIDGNGNKTKYTVDEIGNVIKEKDPKGNIVEYEYDSMGNLLTETDAKGNTVKYTYDQYNNLIKEKESNGAVTKYEYNTNDQVTKETNALGEETETEYNDLGQVVKVTNPLKEIMFEYEYDNEGNVTKITDGNNNTTRMAYDRKGNLIEVKDALGNVVEENEYNIYNDLITSTDALSNKVKMVYNGNGEPLEVEDAKGYKTYYQYTKNSNISSVRDVNSTKIDYEYDGFGNLGKIRYSIRDLDVFERDGNQNIVKEIPYSLGELTYSYDNANQLTKKTNARGQEIEYEYDKNGNVIKETSNEGIVEHTYDSVNNLLTSESGNNLIEREYDLLGRVISKTEDGKQITYAYDKLGHLTEIGYPNGKKVTYDYDVMGNLLKVTDWNNNETVYEYNELNQLIKTNNWNGTVEERKYDKKGQLVEIKTIQGENVLDHFIYEYDENGNIIKENDVIYEYDNLNRLIEAGSNSYSYDNLGNMSSYSIDDTTTRMMYRDNQQLRTINNKVVTVDGDGNLVKYGLNGEETTAEYDLKNRLTKYNQHQYTYNIENERIGVTLGEETTSFVVDTESDKYSRVLEETTGNETKYYIYGHGLIGEYVDEGFTTYHYDLRGSTTTLTDEAGEVLGQVTYDEYGTILSKDEEITTRFLYNGRHGVQTDDNGLYYMRARYYNTDLKRFMNRDVLLGDQSDIQTLNRYAFVNGNPISYHDPFGLARESATGWSISNFIHTALDFAGMIPVFGEVFDVANSIYYLAEGNYEDAIWSGVSAIPFVGNAATVGKYGVKASKQTGNLLKLDLQFFANKGKNPRTRLPRNNGKWEGEPGNGKWYSNKEEVIGVTKGDGVEFIDGRPNFTPWSKGSIHFEKGVLDGTGKDFGRVHKNLKEKLGFSSQKDVREWLRDNKLTPHHFTDTEIQLIPRDLHGNVPHSGSASDMRKILKRGR